MGNVPVMIAIECMIDTGRTPSMTENGQWRWRKTDDSFTPGVIRDKDILPMAVFNRLVATTFKTKEEAIIAAVDAFAAEASMFLSTVGIQEGALVSSNSKNAYSTMSSVFKIIMVVWAALIVTLLAYTVVDVIAKLVVGAFL